MEARSQFQRENPRDPSKLIAVASQLAIAVTGFCATAIFGINAVQEAVKGEDFAEALDLGLLVLSIAIHQRADRLINSLIIQNTRNKTFRVR